MIAIGLLFVRMLCDCFKSRRQLEAEILVLRHQLNVLRQRAPNRLHLRWADRALFIWLYRRCPRILDDGDGAAFQRYPSMRCPEATLPTCRERQTCRLLTCGPNQAAHPGMPSEERDINPPLYD